MEIKTIEYEYLRNPFYGNGGDDVKSIKDTVDELLNQLIQLEKSEISSKMYYQKVLDSFNEVYQNWEGKRGIHSS